MARTTRRVNNGVPVERGDTWRVLERVGRALGEAAGTGPEDDPWLGAQRRGDARGIESLTSGCFVPNIDCMRTTLSLDEDVAAKLQEETRRRRTSFKAVVNDCLRRGFEAPSEAELASPFPVEPRRMGLRAGLDLDDVGGLLDFLDGPVRR